MRRLKWFMLFLMVAMLLNLYPSVSRAMDDIFGLEGMTDMVEPVADDQLDEMRGGYIGGLYFSVYFEGYWNENGEQAAFLDYDGNLNGSSDVDYSITSGAMGGEAVTIRAAVGGLNGAQGIFLITQVPGSFNIVYNNMTVQLAIINILDSSQLNTVHNIISTAFGL